jgi:hypothetical protein
MKTSEYLYGVSSDVWWDMPYGEAIEFKIGCAEILLRKLYLVGFMDRDEVRATAVTNAIKHNKGLLKENS